MALSYKEQVLNNDLLSGGSLSGARLLKIGQNLEFVEQRCKKIDQMHVQDVQNMGMTLNKCRDQVDDALNKNNTAIESHLDNLSEFTNKTISKINNHQNEEHLPKWQELVDSQAKGFIHSFSKSYDKSEEKTLHCEEKVTDLLSSVPKEQKQSQENVMKMVNFSNDSVENLQNSLAELTRLSEERLVTLSEEIDKMATDLNGLVDSEIENRRNEDEMIEGLVEKVIYKMRYL